jgi:uncharacterized membrane protein
MTILVLGLEVPSVHQVNEAELIDFLRESIHPALGYVISFLLIGTYWLEHYAIFHFLTHATRVLIVMNGFFLLCLTFVPFPTGLQAAYRHDELAMVFYGCSLFMCGFSLLVVWLYAIQNRRLVSPNISDVVLQSMTRRLMIAPALCLVAIGCSLISISLSRVILVSIPIFYISHRTVDQGWQASRTVDD